MENLSLVAKQGMREFIGYKLGRFWQLFLPKFYFIYKLLDSFLAILKQRAT